MSLESGQYYITTAAGGFPIGRRLAEDRTLGAKGIYKLPEGTESVWDVEKLDNGNYRLKNRGAIVGSLAAHLYAFLMPEEAAIATTEWTFQCDELRKKDGDAYVITEAPDGRDDGWVVPDSHITPNPHVRSWASSCLSNPPTYPPNEVFFFKKVDA